MQARLEVATGTAGRTQRRAYGYLRLPDSPDDSAPTVLEEAMHDFAELHGLHFVRTFHDFPVGTCDGLQTLIAEMQAAGTTVLLVPSLTHLAASPLLQSMYIERLEAEADAAVVAMDGAEL
jgi:hypothetical protein